MLKQEQENPYILTLGLNLKPPYSLEVAANPYPVGYFMSQFQKSSTNKGNTFEHIVYFLDSLGALSSDQDLCVNSLSLWQIELTLVC